MKVGQKYSFEILGEHPNPHFIVCKIDTDKNKKIISVYLGGLKFKNKHTDNGFGHEISHAPIVLDSLQSSSIKLMEQNVPLPNFEEGYKLWREAFDSGKGGYFSIPPVKVVEYISDSINN